MATVDDVEVDYVDEYVHEDVTLGDRGGGRRTSATQISKLNAREVKNSSTSVMGVKRTGSDRNNNSGSRDTKREVSPACQATAADDRYLLEGVIHRGADRNITNGNSSFSPSDRQLLANIDDVNNANSRFAFTGSRGVHGKAVNAIYGPEIPRNLAVADVSRNSPYIDPTIHKDPDFVSVSGSEDRGREGGGEKLCQIKRRDTSDMAEGRETCAGTEGAFFLSRQTGLKAGEVVDGGDKSFSPDIVEQTEKMSLEDPVVGESRRGAVDAQSQPNQGENPSASSSTRNSRHVSTPSPAPHGTASPRPTPAAISKPSPTPSNNESINEIPPPCAGPTSMDQSDLPCADKPSGINQSKLVYVDSKAGQVTSDPATPDLELSSTEIKALEKLREDVTLEPGSNDSSALDLESDDICTDGEWGVWEEEDICRLELYQDLHSWEESRGSDEELVSKGQPGRGRPKSKPVQRPDKPRPIRAKPKVPAALVNALTHCQVPVTSGHAAGPSGQVTGDSSAICDANVRSLGPVTLEEVGPNEYVLKRCAPNISPTSGLASFASGHSPSPTLVASEVVSPSTGSGNEGLACSNIPQLNRLVPSSSQGSVAAQCRTEKQDCARLPQLKARKNAHSVSPTGQGVEVAASVAHHGTRSKSSDMPVCALARPRSSQSQTSSSVSPTVTGSCVLPPTSPSPSSASNVHPTLSRMSSHTSMSSIQNDGPMKSPRPGPYSRFSPYMSQGQPQLGFACVSPTGQVSCSGSSSANYSSVSGEIINQTLHPAQSICSSGSMNNQLPNTAFQGEGQLPRPMEELPFDQENVNFQAPTIGNFNTCPFPFDTLQLDPQEIEMVLAIQRQHNTIDESNLACPSSTSTATSQQNVQYQISQGISQVPPRSEAERFTGRDQTKFSSAASMSVLGFSGVPVTLPPCKTKGKTRVKTCAPPASKSADKAANPSIDSTQRIIRPGLPVTVTHQQGAGPSHQTTAISQQASLVSSAVKVTAPSGQFYQHHTSTGWQGGTEGLICSKNQPIGQQFIQQALSSAPNIQQFDRVAQSTTANTFQHTDTVAPNTFLPDSNLPHQQTNTVTTESYQGLSLDQLGLPSQLDPHRDTQNWLAKQPFDEDPFLSTLHGDTEAPAFMPPMTNSAPECHLTSCGQGSRGKAQMITPQQFPSAPMPVQESVQDMQSYQGENFAVTPTANQNPGLIQDNPCFQWLLSNEAVMSKSSVQKNPNMSERDSQFNNFDECGGPTAGVGGQFTSGDGGVPSLGIDPASFDSINMESYITPLERENLEKNRQGKSSFDNYIHNPGDQENQSAGRHFPSESLARGDPGPVPGLDQYLLASAYDLQSDVKGAAGQAHQNLSPSGLHAQHKLGLNIPPGDINHASNLSNSDATNQAVPRYHTRMGTGSSCTAISTEAESSAYPRDTLKRPMHSGNLAPGYPDASAGLHLHVCGPPGYQPSQPQPRDLTISTHPPRQQFVLPVSSKSYNHLERFSFQPKQTPFGINTSIPDATLLSSGLLTASTNTPVCTNITQMPRQPQLLTQPPVPGTSERVEQGYNQSYSTDLLSSPISQLRSPRPNTQTGPSMALSTTNQTTAIPTEDIGSDLSELPGLFSSSDVEMQSSSLNKSLKDITGTNKCKNLTQLPRYDETKHLTCQSRPSEDTNFTFHSFHSQQRGIPTQLEQDDGHSQVHHPPPQLLQQFQEPYHQQPHQHHLADTQTRGAGGSRLSLSNDISMSSEEGPRLLPNVRSVPDNSDLFYRWVQQSQQLHYLQQQQKQQWQQQQQQNQQFSSEEQMSMSGDFSVGGISQATSPQNLLRPHQQQSCQGLVSEEIVHKHQNYHSPQLPVHSGGNYERLSKQQQQQQQVQPHLQQQSHKLSFQQQQPMVEPSSNPQHGQVARSPDNAPTKANPEVPVGKLTRQSLLALQRHIASKQPQNQLSFDPHQQRQSAESSQSQRSQDRSTVLNSQSPASNFRVSDSPSSDRSSALSQNQRVNVACRQNQGPSLRGQSCTLHRSPNSERQDLQLQQHQQQQQQLQQSQIPYHQQQTQLQHQQQTQNQQQQQQLQQSQIPYHQQQTQLQHQQQTQNQQQQQQLQQSQNSYHQQQTQLQHQQQTQNQQQQQQMQQSQQQQQQEQEKQLRLQQIHLRYQHLLQQERKQQQQHYGGAGVHQQLNLQQSTTIPIETSVTQQGHRQYTGPPRTQILQEQYHTLQQPSFPQQQQQQQQAQQQVTRDSASQLMTCQPYISGRRDNTQYQVQTNLSSRPPVMLSQGSTESPVMSGLTGNAPISPAGLSEESIAFEQYRLGGFPSLDLADESLSFTPRGWSDIPGLPTEKQTPAEKGSGGSKSSTTQLPTPQQQHQQQQQQHVGASGKAAQPDIVTNGKSLLSSPIEGQGVDKPKKHDSDVSAITLEDSSLSSGFDLEIGDIWLHQLIHATKDVATMKNAAAHPGFYKALNTKNNRGETALFVAVSDDEDDDVDAEEVVRFLLAHGADPNVSCPNLLDQWQTCLHEAVARGKTRCVRALLSARKQIVVDSKRPDFGVTPLMLALEIHKTENRRDIVFLLLENKASLYARNSVTGETPLMIAVQSGDSSLVDHLIKKAGVEAARELVSHTTTGGWTCLHFAADLKGPDRDKRKMIRCIIEAGGDVSARNNDRYLPKDFDRANIEYVLARLSSSQGQSNL